MMQLRVEYVYDSDVNSWGFAVPALHIGTRDAAREEATAAITFALDDMGGPTPVVRAAETEVLDVTFRPSSAA